MSETEPTKVNSRGPASVFLEMVTESVSAGNALVLIDDHTGNGSADLFAAAALITKSKMAFFVRHTAGLITVALPERHCDRMLLPPVSAKAGDWKAATHAVAVDASAGVGTGISATDRAHTARLLANPGAVPSDFTRPGHLVPHRVPREAYREGTADMISTALYLCTRADLPAAVRAELVHDEGDCLDKEAALTFAGEHDILAVSMTDVLRAVNPTAIHPDDRSRVKPSPSG